MTPRRLFALLGGSWHDYAGFAQSSASWLQSAGYHVEVAFDPASLDQLEARAADVVVLHNCFDQAAATDYTEPQLEALVRWVNEGGRVLALHAATVAARRHPALRNLLGAAFVDHPPQGLLVVHAVGPSHPMNSVDTPFEVEDELYRHDLEPDPVVHLVASRGTERHPVAWSLRRGRGRVAYLALGHDEHVWRLGPFRELVEASLGWLLEPGQTPCPGRQRIQSSTKTPGIRS